MEKNLPLSVVALLAVWFLAGCGSDTTARSIEATRC